MLKATFVSPAIISTRTLFLTPTPTPTLLLKQRYMNTSRDPLAIYIDQPFECTELGKRKNMFRLNGAFPTISAGEAFSVKRRTHKTMLLKDEEGRLGGDGGEEIMIMDVKWYELADGRGWINDLTPAVMMEITTTTTAQTVHIPYEKRTILIDPSSLLMAKDEGDDKKEDGGDGGGDGDGGGGGGDGGEQKDDKGSGDEGEEKSSAAMWARMRESLSTVEVRVSHPSAPKDTLPTQQRTTYPNCSTL